MEEISLKELIEIVLKGKRFIIAFTIACILISAILSFIVLQPVYESKGTFSVKPISIGSGINPNTTVIFSGDPNTIDSVRKLENKMLGSILSQVRYPQFDVPAMVNFMNSTEYMEKIMKDFGIDTEKYDYVENIKIGVDTKTNLISVNVKFNDGDTAVKVKRAIINYLPQFMSAKANGIIDTTSKMLIEAVDRENANYKEWDTKVQQIEASAGGKEEHQGEYEEAKNSYILAGQALSSYQLVMKELENIKAINIQDMMNLQVISKDKLPLKPISPNKKMNLAIAAVLGIMVSVFVVFAKEYWRNNFKLPDKMTEN